MSTSDESRPERGMRTALAQPHIRGTRPADSEAISALINLPGVRFNTLRLPFETPEEVRLRLEGASRLDISLVALLGDRLVGWGDMRRFTGRRAHLGELGVCVHDAYCGGGIGTALLTALVDTADRWLGLQRLQLTVFTDNQRAIGLYRKFGFAVEGTLRAYALRDGALTDAYSMARLVGCDNAQAAPGAACATSHHSL
jgi:L-phenylalanine/L-methionine N-acetyltransferase